MLVDALNRLRELRQIAAQAHHDATVIEALLLEALAHAALHTTPAALDALTRALDLAEPEGHIRLFVDLGAGLTPLLQQVIPSSERHHSYIDRLLKAFGVAPAVTPTSTILHPSVLIEPLSPREREVLELLAQGLSNEAIARVLVVSIATVKKHATGIFSKLGVSSRTQAVARARELGLLA
jgi:LuxR family maltose regulon positive regulatory protein